MFTIGYFHLAVITCIYLVGYYCDALDFSARKDGKLIRSLSQLVQAVRTFWQK